MKVQINSYIKRDVWGSFLHGQVFFESLVKNNEAKSIPSYLIVNLSKSGNPQCDTSIKFLQSHNAHAGTFHSHTLMREYIKRVTTDLTNVIDKYNMEQEETQQTPDKLNHAIIEDNEDLAPPPAPAYVLPPGVVVMDVEHIQHMNDMLIDTLEDIIEEDED
jgi:hypothetical protein